MISRTLTLLLTTFVLCFGSTNSFAADPVCSSPAADPDGDGWGWENSASCIVTATSTNTSTTNTSTTTAGNTCSSAAADSDGDGWGWENNASCIVVAGNTTGNTSTQTNQTMANQTTANQTSATPVCSSASFDQDGDGYGWENNTSCIVQTQAASTTEDPATANPVARSIRIMALGDSITHGYSASNATSYRRPLVDLLNSNSCQYQMVGSRSGNFGHNTFVSPHEGYNGFTADEILGAFAGAGGSNPGVGVTVNRYQPDVVLLHIGTNDMRKGQNIEQTVSEIDQIVSILMSANSSPTVMLANVIPWYGSVGPNVATLGDQIEAYVAQLGNSKVQLIDVRSGYQQSMMLGDGVHPNPSGESHIANRFFQMYTRAGFCG